MISNKITRYGFPGTAKKQSHQPAKGIERLNRSKGSGFIEWIPVNQESGATLIVFVCHGRGRGLDQNSFDNWLKLAKEERVIFILHNYPGYDATPGPPTAELIGQDCIDVLAHVREQTWAKGKEMVLFGNSIGCGPTMWLASQRPLDVKKVVLVSPYMSITALAQIWTGGKEWFDKWVGMDPTSLLAKAAETVGVEPFPLLELALKLENLSILLLHGEEDDLIPPDHSKKIFEKLENPCDSYKRSGITVTRTIIRGANHGQTRHMGKDHIFKFVHGDDRETIDTGRSLKPEHSPDIQKEED